MEPTEARRILGLESMEGALDRQRLQSAFHRRLFEIHPDTGHAIQMPGLSVDTLIEARKTLLIRLEKQSQPDAQSQPFESTSGDGGAGRARGVEQGGDSRVSEATSDAVGKKANDSGSGPEGYNLYRKALFLYSEAILAYFENRKRVQGKTVSEPSAEPETFRSHLEEARSLFVQVLERFPGGTWTPDAIEQIARINVWLKRDRSGGG